MSRARTGAAARATTAAATAGATAGTALGSVAPALGLVLALALAACSEPETTERATVLPAVALAETTAAPGTVGPAGRPTGAGGTSAPAGGGGDAVLCVDTARSLVRWRGTEVGGGSHEGVVRMAGGRLRVAKDGRVTGGDIVVDMRTIAVTDIPPHEVEARENLRSHLAHEEFFGVDRFPTARLVLTGVRGGEHGLYSVSGNLAIRDSVHNVTFEATAPVVGPEGVWATADFAIDRYQWGIEFDGRTSTLRNALVHDLIRLEVTVVAGAEWCREPGAP